jgi:uncharacterized protein YndB with AHSA1/START domain
MASFTLEREIAAPPEVVFDVLTDHRRYSEITMLRRAELEREGEPAPNGVGALRVLSAAPGAPLLREEVIAYERPTRFSYTLLSGLPVRDHIGTAELTPQGSGTRVVYAVRTTPTVPIAGGAVVRLVKLGIQQLLNGVSAESERRAAVHG